MVEQQESGEEASNHINQIHEQIELCCRPLKHKHCQWEYNFDERHIVSKYIAMQNPNECIIE